GLNIGEEERHIEEEEEDELYKDININQGRRIQAYLEVEDSHVTLTPVNPDDQVSKRRREGKEHESASAPTETATRSAGRSGQGSISRQVSANESALPEEPM
nr:hypothetical protein [Tanacetum cinerariifolium]